MSIKLIKKYGEYVDNTLIHEFYQLEDSITEQLKSKMVDPEDQGRINSKFRIIDSYFSNLNLSLSLAKRGNLITILNKQRQLHEYLSSSLDRIKAQGRPEDLNLIDNYLGRLSSLNTILEILETVNILRCCPNRKSKIKHYLRNNPKVLSFSELDTSKSIRSLVTELRKEYEEVFDV